MYMCVSLVSPIEIMQMIFMRCFKTDGAVEFHHLLFSSSTSSSCRVVSNIRSNGSEGGVTRTSIKKRFTTDDFEKNKKEWIKEQLENSNSLHLANQLWKKERKTKKWKREIKTNRLWHFEMMDRLNVTQVSDIHRFPYNSKLLNIVFKYSSGIGWHPLKMCIKWWR